MKFYIPFLFIIYLLIYLLPLGGKPLIAPDEFRYAEIPREMIQSGDWVTPRLIGVRYFEKPVMGYWLNAISMLLFGENSFAIRFAAAFATGITAGMVFFLSYKVTKDQVFSWLAAAIFLTSGLVYFIGTFAVLDSPTSMFITGTLVFFFLAYRERNWNSHKISYLVICGTFCGMAFLTKGFIAFAVPTVTIIPFLILEKRWRDLFILPWIPLFFVLLVAAPWALVINQREPDFWRYFIWVEHIQRFLSKDGTQHPEPFWFYLPVILGGLLPWAILLPCAFKGLSSANRINIPVSFRNFIICWILFPMIFFSVCNGKLPTYVLPLFPPLALLLAWGLSGYFKNASDKLFNITCVILSRAMLVGAIGFAAYQLLANYGFFAELYSSKETYKWLIAVFTILIWSGFLFLASKKGTGVKKILLFTLAPLTVFYVSNYIAPDRVLSNKAQGLYFSKWKEFISSETVIVAHPNVMHAAAWEFRRTNLLFSEHGGELEYGLKYPENKHRIIPKNEFESMVKKSKPGSLVHVIRGEFRDSGQKADFEIYDHEMMFAKF